MRYIKTNFIFKIIILCLFVTFMNISVYSRICGNGAGDGYGDEGDETNGKGTVIEIYIIEGAGHFLKTNSDISLFLNKIELADLRGIDYDEVSLIIDSAWKSINRAKDTYNDLIKIAEVTPYNEIVIEKLVNFNYTSFMKENGLNSVILKEVEEYLKIGDITGTFRRIRSSFDRIIEHINLIKGDITLNKMPDLKNMWTLNKEITHTLLFGQYMSEIFHEIR